LKLKHNELLSNFAFNCNLRRYSVDFAQLIIFYVDPAFGGAVQVDPRLTPT